MTTKQRRSGASAKHMATFNDFAETVKRTTGTVCAAAVFAVSSAGAFADQTIAAPAPKADLPEIAAAYVQFRKDVAEIKAMGMDSADETREAHKRLAAHDPDTLAQGWVAYVALVAADSPDFSKGLQKSLRRTKRDKMIAKLSTDLNYAATLPGANKAVEAVLQTAASDAAYLTSLGKEFEEAAYALQKTQWGVKPVADRGSRFETAKSFAASRPKAEAPNMGELKGKGARGVVAPSLASAGVPWSASWAAAEAEGDVQLSGPRAEPMMQQVLTLAARYSLDAAKPGDQALAVLVQNKKGARCVKWAKLHLDQCLAATRAPYEEAYCFGRHGLSDVSECVGWVASES
ncbi:MAG: hypothetical protein AAGC95_14215 [Pseudomonadota bacterium]